MIIVNFEGKGLTKEMYETLRKEVKWESQPSDGAIVHAARFDENGEIHVVDIWESQEKMENFVNTRLVPVMKKHNMPVPQVEVYPAYNINVFKTTQ